MKTGMRGDRKRTRNLTPGGGAVQGAAERIPPSRREASLDRDFQNWIRITRHPHDIEDLVPANRACRKGIAGRVTMMDRVWGELDRWTDSLRDGTIESRNLLHQPRDAVLFFRFDTVRDQQSLQ